MLPVKLLIFTMTLCKLARNLDAKTCPKGQRVVATSRRESCRDCENGFFQPEENDSMSCRVCTRCEEDTGSEVVEVCTTVTNTKCRCRAGFVPRDTSDSSTCKCERGFGLNGTACVKCEDGYFSRSMNSPCQKWKECKSVGVKINGTKTSDVICNEESKSNTPATADPTSKSVVCSLISRVTSHRPHGGAQTQKTLTTTTTSAPGHSIAPMADIVPSNKGNHFGALIAFAIVAVVALIFLTFKLYAHPHTQKHSELQKHESLCQPVMEIGDSSRSSIKLNPDEL